MTRLNHLTAELAYDLTSKMFSYYLIYNAAASFSIVSNWSEVLWSNSKDLKMAVTLA